MLAVELLVSTLTEVTIVNIIVVIVSDIITECCHLIFTEMHAKLESGFRLGACRLELIV